VRFLLILISLLAPQVALGFCGFYVGGAGAELFNDATQVVLMREGNQTVLSMQNRYTGPAQDFAMVIPVPVVLKEEDVRTLSPEIFEKIDTLTSPRLVEYWERNPCMDTPQADPKSLKMAYSAAVNSGVKVEAEFEVDEYDVVVLSAQDSAGLDTWLVQNNFNVPEEAAPYYQPYINSGMYFFVAKVDASKVVFDHAGNVVLSPLRFSYTSDEFSLPIRLGMINSNGEQDLIVQVIGKQQRYELANYPNVFIPTNLEVMPEVYDNFGEFYKSLFARTLEQNPGAAVTEYSWDVSTCDPCPGDVWLDSSDVTMLGGDVLFPSGGASGMVVTRLHLRYGKDEIGEDLVFKTAPAVIGGRQDLDRSGNLIREVLPSSVNNFQARYIIRHRWTGTPLCVSPTRNSWDSQGAPRSAPGPTTTRASLKTSSDFVLEDLIRDDIPSLGLVSRSPQLPMTQGCSRGCTSGGAALAIPGFFLVLGWRRKKGTRK